MRDVCIIGAGPTGSFLAALLSKRGFSVSLFDKQRSPIPHLPETLISEEMNPLEEIGISSIDVLTCCSKPISVRFLNPLGTQSLKITHEFFDNSLLLIDRMNFDEILLKSAEGFGVDYRAPCVVSSAQFNPKDCSVLYTENGKDKIENCRMVVDASGKSSLFLRLFERKLKRKILDTDMCIFSHFEGILPNLRGGFDSMSIIEIDQGHVFIIPITLNRISVGVILPRESVLDPNKIFEDSVKQIPWLKELLNTLKKVFPCICVENQGYEGINICSPRHLVLGEASFLPDPFFSNGIGFSMTMAKKGADLLSYLLKKDATHKEKLRKCKDYSLDYRKTVRLTKSGVYDRMEKKISTIRHKTLVDPHIPYSLLFYLLKLCDEKLSASSTLKKLRKNQDSISNKH